MGITQKELLHGAVLSKLVKRSKNSSLTLVEWDKAKLGFSAYDICDAVLFVKVSTAPKGRSDKKLRWLFTFSDTHIQKLLEFGKKYVDVNVVLVCASKSIDKGKKEICFLRRKLVEELLDLNSSDSQTIWVELPHSAKKFRVSGNMHKDKKPELVRLNELEHWTPPYE